MTEETTKPTIVNTIKVINIHRGPVYINGKYLPVGKSATLRQATAEDLIEKGYVKAIK